MKLSREEMQKIVDEAPEGAIHIISETYVKMNGDSVDSGWCKIWFNGKWVRNGYISNCTSLYDVRKVLVSKAFEGAHINPNIAAIAFNVETPEEKEAFDNIKVTKVDDKQSVKVETEHQKEMAEFGWDGEGLPPVGVVCIFSPKQPEIVKKHSVFGDAIERKVLVVFHDEDLAVAKWAGRYESFRGSDFKPLESPEDKEERERLESAYDLYCHARSVLGHVGSTFENFQGNCMGFTKDEYLAIVDKTKYRKGVA